MDKFSIGVYGIVKRDSYLDSGFIKEISVNFRDFDSNLCGGTQDSLTKPVCENRRHFEDAGILYITFTVISHFFALYSVIGMLGIFCKCSSLGVATVQVIHYLYPCLHGLALILYFTVSQMFNLTTPGYSNSKYRTSLTTGFILMIIAQVLGFMSMAVFGLSRRALILFTKVRPRDVLKRKK